MSNTSSSNLPQYYWETTKELDESLRTCYTVRVYKRGGGRTPIEEATYYQEYYADREGDRLVNYYMSLGN